jgi:hypothetical protein
VRNLKQSLIDSGDAMLAKMEDDHRQLTKRVRDLSELLEEIEGEPAEDEDPESTRCLKALHAAEKDGRTKLAKITAP